MEDLTQIKEQIYIHNSANPYVDITPFALNLAFPVINYIGFFPDADETVIYAAPASTFKDKEQVVGYTGSSGGASFRVAKGVTVRTGSSGSQAIRQTVRNQNTGDLIVTNKRVVFIGKDDNFEINIAKISALKILSSETFVIHAGNKAKNIYANTEILKYVYVFTELVIDACSKNGGSYAIVQHDESRITPEQRALCEQIKREIEENPPKIKQKKQKRKNRYGCLWSIAGVFFFIFILMCILIANS